VKLLTVIVSYNRPELLRRTVRSYQKTVTLDHYLLIVDNRSDAKTRRWLRACGVDVVFLPENRYPGWATNHGWEAGLKKIKATHLHRSDNDFEYQPGWCDEVVAQFADPQLGQLGLRTVEEEGSVGAVGGCSIIRREIWDAGVRYSEAPWHEMPWEDTHMSRDVEAAGYRWGRVTRPCATHIGLASSQDPYYQETFTVRNITFASWGIE
jgi:glycosyltransferase involved in cell wall biosynthesis